LEIKDQQEEDEKNSTAEASINSSANDQSKADLQSDLELRTRELVVLQNDLESEKRKSLDLVNRMRYLQADIANLQRQSDRRVSEVRNQVKLTWILEIVSIKEDLDRAVGLARESGEKSSLLDGLLLVTSRIDNILKLETVEVIRAEAGGRFDPNVHEALAFQESETEEQGTILSVISPGYSVEGKVIKPAMVEVARKRDRKKSEEQVDVGRKFPSKGMEIEEASQQKKS
jgi:molecular chaperone GrpE